jgi:hypothetical protein
MLRVHRSRARDAGFRQLGSRNTLILRQFLWTQIIGAVAWALRHAPNRELALDDGDGSRSRAVAEIAQGKDAGAELRKLASFGQRNAAVRAENQNPDVSVMRHDASDLLRPAHPGPMIDGNCNREHTLAGSDANASRPTLVRWHRAAR